MKTLFGMGMGMLGMVAACSVPEAEAVDTNVELASDVVPEGKTPGASASVTMTCTQGTGGCVPRGYRAANCTISNLKPNTYVVPCVDAACPTLYGASCFAPQKVATDGTAHAFFALAPDATYSFNTYSGTKSGASNTVIASTSLTLVSGIGEATQCGGEPSPTCL